MYPVAAYLSRILGPPRPVIKAVSAELLNAVATYERVAVRAQSRNLYASILSGTYLRRRLPLIRQWRSSIENSPRSAPRVVGSAVTQNGLFSLQYAHHCVDSGRHAALNGQRYGGRTPGMIFVAQNAPCTSHDFIFLNDCMNRRFNHSKAVF